MMKQNTKITRADLIPSGDLPRGTELLRMGPRQLAILVNFAFRLPGYDDHVETTQNTVKALGLIAAQALRLILVSDIRTS